MGLFDDILKKPVTTLPPSDPLTHMHMTESSSPEQVLHSGVAPIVIEKSSEEVIFGENSEALDIAKQNAPMATPTIHAEEDTSSILVGTNSEPTSPASIVVTPTVETPFLIPSMPTNPLPSDSTGLIPTPSEAPVAVPLINIIPQGVSLSPVLEASPVQSSSIFDSIMAEKPAEVASSVTVVPEVTVSLESPATPPPASSVYTASFATPRAFIEQSIANIDVMLGNIDRRHDAKATEEESYKIEKLRFTDLERTAHTEKIIMDKERDHALHMRQILESERQRDENNRAEKESSTVSVTSTLAGIGEEHAISHKHSHKKMEVRKEEELLAAS